MAKHTPGPWVIDTDYIMAPNDKNQRGYWNEEEPENVCIVGCKEECDANAYLIAAAPDMYEALNFACKELCNHNLHMSCKDCIVEHAIAKAEGKGE